jgi:SAM-dependent methyltransferase
MSPAPEPIRIDLGCGGAKRPGFVGLDCFDAPGVDHVIDLTSETFPFADDSVDHVHSSHFLEHIGPPNHVFGEIGRVCRDGATIEIWTPYAFSDEAFLYGHTTFLTETSWMHFCVLHRDAHFAMLNGRWLLDRITFVVAPDVQAELEANGTPLPFAIKYLKGVVEEFGVSMTYQSSWDAPVVQPRRYCATHRAGPAVELSAGEPHQSRSGTSRLRTSASPTRIRRRITRLARSAWGSRPRNAT